MMRSMDERFPVPRYTPPPPTLATGRSAPADPGRDTPSRLHPHPPGYRFGREWVGEGFFLNEGRVPCDLPSIRGGGGGRPEGLTLELLNIR